MTQPETFTVDTPSFYCDGGGAIAPELGHPRVFLTVAASGTIDCPYCGRHYILNQSAARAAGH
ncbi:MAG: zinc-finger domain-containing protein [Alphaproteobacteria bacterium]|nr:zinc-finger domain-containing protein [Alphaproteobacteria bacterium]MBV8548120.1 zinc-finger domain-containing protein [Alphaproteobacteria bacterium]